MINEHLINGFLIELSKELQRKGLDEYKGNPSYGAKYENDVFMIHNFCWCDKDECLWCREENPMPNFWYKPLDFKVYWYKYIGRDIRYNEEFSFNQFIEMINQCIKSIEK